MFTTRINNIVTAYPKLSRIWIKTGDPKTPLQAVWRNESKLHGVSNDPHRANRNDESGELAEDHLCFAA